MALVTILGVLGGGFYGRKKWADGPKDYYSIAKLSVHIRPPFVAKAAKLDDVGSRLDNLNEEAVLRDLKSDETLAPVIEAFDLAQAWGLGTDDALTELRSSVDLEHDRLDKELRVRVSRHDPVEAANIANMIADGVYERIKVVDERQKLEGARILEQELTPFLEAEEDARMALKEAFAAKKINIDPKPGMDVSAYLLEPSIRDAHLEWDTARETMIGVKDSQRAFESHWSRKLRPTIVTDKAVPATFFYGPQVEPIQMQWALYGLTFGLIVGSLLSLLCWKLFP